MTPRTSVFLPLLLMATATFAEDKPAAQTAPAAKPTFDLRDEALKKIVRETATHAAAAMPRASSTEPTTTVATQLGTLPMRKNGAPISVNCDGITKDCVALDANGKELYLIPRWQVFGMNSSDPSTVAPCQSSNNLLSTFDRADRCRGVGLLLPTPWDGVNFTLPVFSQN